MFFGLCVKKIFNDPNLKIIDTNLFEEKEREIANSFQERIVRFEKEVLKQKTIPWMPPSNVVPRKFTPSKPNNPPRRRTTANGNNSWLFGNRRSYSTNF